MGEIAEIRSALLYEAAASGVSEELLQWEPVPCNVLARLAAWESKNLWRLSWASITVQVSNLMLSLVSQMFVGHLGTLEFAGAAITVVGIQGLANGITFGMATAVQTVCGQAYGAQKHRAMGIVLQRALILNLVAAFLLSFLFWYSGTILRAIGQTEAIAAVGQIYGRGLLPQLIAYALYCPMQRFLQAQTIIKPTAYMSVAALLFHILLSWLVVFVFNLGLLGASLSLSFTWLLLTLATWLYIIYNPSCKDSWTGFSTEAFKGLWPYLKLTVASAVMLVLEIWYFKGFVLLTGYLKDPEIALDSVSICVNYWNLDFVIMLGLSNAASVRIGNELGAAHPRVAKFAVLVVVVTSIIMSVVISVLVFLLRVPLSKLYSSSTVVIETVSDLAPLLSISVFLNGVQPVLSGVAVGSGWQAIVAYVNVGTYYFLGLPIGCVLGFKTSLGAAGIWWGLIIGVFTQTLILIIITARTNWEEEVDKAIERLKHDTQGDTTLATVDIQ